MVKVCSRCILDSNFPNITFDSNGVCNYCKGYERQNLRTPVNIQENNKLDAVINKIRGRGKRYDCIIGASGGRDSSYCLYLLKKWNLRPYVFCCDIGMNSEIANNNLRKICNKLDFDLNVYTVDNDEYCDLQKSFFKASIPAVDAPQDHAIFTQLDTCAYENDIKYIFTGSSFRTEGPIPSEWSCANDPTFIRDIQKKFGEINLEKFPLYNPFDFKRFLSKRMKRVNPLNHIEYILSDVDRILETELDWVNYGGHHFDSIITRWLHAYYLPVKFGIDKRGTDYSVLIRSGQLTRDEALSKMEEEFYSAEQETEDRAFIMNRLNLSGDEMESYLTAPPKLNSDYRHQPVYMRILNFLTRPRGI